MLLTSRMEGKTKTDHGHNGICTIQSSMLKPVASESKLIWSIVNDARPGNTKNPGSYFDSSAELLARDRTHGLNCPERVVGLFLILRSVSQPVRGEIFTLLIGCETERRIKKGPTTRSGQVSKP